MPLSVDGIKGAIAAGFHRLVGGRIARTTFAIRVAILVGAIYLLALPLSTILTPSSKILKDLYLALFLGMLAVCLIGIVSAYVKRLHDIGLPGYWAVVALIGIPVLIGWGLTSYAAYSWRQDNSFETAEVNELAAWLVFGVPLLIALWRGQPKKNRFGEVPLPVEHFAASRSNIVALGGAAAILIPTSIYVGLFQRGVWVGRSDLAPSMPMIGSTGEGQVFMKCWNVKGVGAGTGKGSLSGIYRDGYEGVFDFVQLPDGRIDIVPAGQAVSKSYLADGFRIVPYGLNLPRDRDRLINEKLDQFMLVAVFDQGGQDAAVNFTAFTFGPSEKRFPPYEVVMTTGLSSSDDATGGLATFPRARGRLMIGDCFAG